MRNVIGCEDMGLNSVMAVGRLLLGCAISLLVLRLLMLFGLLKVNLNHASEVSPYFWRFCKLNDFVRPCSTRIIIRHRRDFIKPIGFAAGLLLLLETLRLSLVQAVYRGSRTYPTALLSSVFT